MAVLYLFVLWLTAAGASPTNRVAQNPVNKTAATKTAAPVDSGINYYYLY